MTRFGCALAFLCFGIYLPLCPANADEPNSLPMDATGLWRQGEWDRTGDEIFRMMRKRPPSNDLDIIMRLNNERRERRKQDPESRREFYQAIKMPGRPGAHCNPIRFSLEQGTDGLTGLNVRVANQPLPEGAASPIVPIDHKMTPAAPTETVESVSLLIGDPGCRLRITVARE